MQVGAIQKIITIFDEAFHHLGVSVEARTVEGFAVVVHRAMTIQGRNYHNLEHVFGFVEPSNPLRTLAALYHDIVYYQVDRGFLPEIWEIVQPYILEQDGQFSLTQNTLQDNCLLDCAMGIFDFQPGMTLQLYSGLNEFLSALVMEKHLGEVLSKKDLLKITVCIEGTIPFRGEDHFYRLEERLRRTSQQQGLSLPTHEIEDSLKLAVRFANTDVENFAEEDVGKFLETTWKLLPETNVALRSPEVYTIREYRQALYNMEVLLSTLNPNHVFHSYRDEPPENEYRQVVERVHRNIATACEYLRLKLLAQSILEALAEATGGDVPQALFMGDIPSDSERPQRLEDFLPTIQQASWVDTKSTIYELLVSSRVGEASFDLKASPLSLYLYESLEPDRRKALLSLAKEMFEGCISAEVFLDQLDPPVLHAVAWASAAMVVTRREELMKYAK